MRTSTNTLLLLALLANVVSGQTPSWPWPIIDKDDPIRPFLDAWQAALEARYEEDKASRPQFLEWVGIESDDLRALAPNHRFAMIRWHEMEHPEATTKMIARASLQTTLAIDPATGAVTDFQKSGDYQDFGRFLAERSVRIVTEADARRVWAAFFDVYRIGWGGRPPIRVDESTWHFGVNERNDVRYYYEVKVDSEHRVTSGRSRYVAIRQG